jgi:DNA-binding NtrC family response regulator
LVLLNSVESIRECLDQLPGFGTIVGRSPALLKVLDTSVRVANRQTPILIIGETGTGKESLARAIHENSSMRNGPFVKIACSLLRSDSSKLTFLSEPVETARTLYLEDITELPPHLQVELTQLLHEAESAGTGDPVRSPVRVIASTILHGNLAAEAKLRPELYYRISVVPLQLPPLRERKEDLPELAEFFADRLARRYQLTNESIPAAVHKRLSQYHWPGNIRELENAVERMMLLAADFDFSEQNDVAIGMVAQQDNSSKPFSQGLPERGLNLAQIERDLLVAALAKFGGNQTKAARYLNISRRTLIYRMGKYKLRFSDSNEQA